MFKKAAEGSQKDLKVSNVIRIVGVHPCGETELDQSSGSHTIPQSFTGFSCTVKGPSPRKIPDFSSTYPPQFWKKHGPRSLPDR